MPPTITLSFTDAETIATLLQQYQWRDTELAAKSKDAVVRTNLTQRADATRNLVTLLHTQLYPV